MFLEFHQESSEISSSESPPEGMCQPGIAHLELKQTIPHLSQREEVIRCEHLALDNREIDFDLVEPTRIGRRVDHDDARMACLQLFGCAFASVG